MDGHASSSQDAAGAPFEPGPRCSCVLPLACGHELVDVGGDRLVEIVFVVVEHEGDGVAWRSGKSRWPSMSLQVFLEPAQRPRAIGAQGANVAADFDAVSPSRCGSGKQVGIDQPDEMGEPVLIAVVRRGCEQQDVVGIGWRVSRPADSAWSSPPASLTA